MNIHPVVGRLMPDDTAIRLGTGYFQFDIRAMAGLCRVNHLSIEILAVYSKQPGEGNFRQFVDDLRRNYNRIVFWVIWSPVLRVALKRYGFTPVEARDSDGARIEGMQIYAPMRSLISC